MSIDDRIKRELENEASELDTLLSEPEGVLQMGMGALRGSLGRWVILVGVVTLMVSIVMVWCGYRFYVAVDVGERVFWGVWLVVTLIAQVAMKQWTWMEMRRVSILREIKRVEVAVERLASDLSRAAP